MPSSFPEARRPSSQSLPPFRGLLPVFVVSLVMLVWSYGFFVSNFTISIDEELHVAGLADLNLEWLRSGRWAIYLFKWLVGGMGVTPFFSGTFSLLLLAGAAAALQQGFRTVQREPAAEDGSWLLTALIFPTTPLFIFSLCFATFDAAIGFGIFLAIVSAVLAAGVIHRGQRIFHAVISAALLAVAVGVYQPMVILWLVALVGFQLSALMQPDAEPARLRRDLARFAAWLAATGVAGLVLYKIVDATVSHYAGKSGYLEGYFGFPKVPYGVAIGRLFDGARDVLTGKSFQAGAGWRLLLWVELAAALLILGRAWRGKRLRSAAALGLGLALLPFALSWITGLVIVPTGFTLPARTFFPLAASLTALLVVAWQATRSRALRGVLLAAAAIAAVGNVRWLNEVALADYRRYQDDVFFARAIGQEARKLSAPLGAKPVRLAVVGTHEANADIFGYKGEALGYSLFEWDGGNPYRVRAFLKTQGFVYAEPSLQDIKQAMKESETMDAWPGATAVRLKDDLLIVKLSPPTVHQVYRYGK